MSKRTNKRSATNDRGTNLHRLAVGYMRVSTAGQGEKGTSFEAQRAAIEAYADALGYTLIEIFEDVASGVRAKSFYNRKKLQAALDLAVLNDASLIVWDWDRLTRFADFEKQVQKVLPDRSRIICAKDGMNMMEASRAAQFAHGEKVAEIISKTTKEGMAKKKEQGVTFGNPDIRTKVQPLGTLTWSSKREEHDHALADVLRRLPDPFAITRSEAAELFVEHGLRTLHNKEWTKSRVTEPLRRARAILRDEERAKISSSPNFGMF